MGVRQINRSNFRTDQPKVYTGTKVSWRLQRGRFGQARAAQTSTSVWPTSVNVATPFASILKTARPAWIVVPALSPVEMLMKVPLRKELKPGPLALAVRDLPLAGLVYFTTRRPVIAALKAVGVSSKTVMYSLLTGTVTTRSNSVSVIGLKQVRVNWSGN